MYEVKIIGIRNAKTTVREKNFIKVGFIIDVFKQEKVHTNRFDLLPSKLSKKYASFIEN
ncbi:unnamed protein product [Bacillus thuringiensis DB27]|uniref:Uncharacterized protein n=1 Tax=Bacillus thuringiensis DB27 TaxID=1431339 RepID=W8ZAA6_BACTU|nr:unnamed protein product [Bacillus thuringiensis DB27]